MGVVNVTPDSFSDGGRYLDAGCGDRARPRSSCATAPTSSMSAARRRTRAPQPIAAAEELAPRAAGDRGAGRAPVRRSRSTRRRPRSRAPRSPPARDRQRRLRRPVRSGDGARRSASGVTYIAGHLRGRSLAEVFAAESRAGRPGTRSPPSSRDRLAALPGTRARRAGSTPASVSARAPTATRNLALLRHAGDLARAARAPGRGRAEPQAIPPRRLARQRRARLTPRSTSRPVAACLGGGARRREDGPGPQRCLAPRRTRRVHQVVERARSIEHAGPRLPSP